MYKTKTTHVKIALKAIQLSVEQGDTTEMESDNIPDELQKINACFVSIHKKDGSLRGCIGTLEPRCDNLYLEIVKNAFSAAMRDSRFNPLTSDEIEDIVVSVDVLSEPVKIKNISELDPKKYGVIVSSEGFSRAVLLPAIEGIDTVEEQLRIVKRKAGIYNIDNEFLKILRFTATRYY